MVAGLFLLALVSFAVMGLFVVGLTIYGSLRGRAERADLAHDALIALFASRQALVAELEVLARELAVVSGGEPGGLPESPLVPGAHGPAPGIAAWADFDRASRQFAGLVVERGMRLHPDAPRVAALERRCRDTDRAVADALRAYNSAAAEFNNARALVPAAFVARVSGLGEREFLVLSE